MAVVGAELQIMDGTGKIQFIPLGDLNEKEAIDNRLKNLVLYF